MSCPRRAELGPWTLIGPDETHDGRCTFCGSITEEAFIAACERGDKLGPTDKNYKVYVELPENKHAKFYFQHLSPNNGKKFVELLNAKHLNIDYPGHFYVRPYFCVPVK